MPNNLAAELKRQAVQAETPAQLTISVAQTDRLAQQFNTSRRVIELTALENGIVPLRYLRNLNTYTADQQLRLLQSQVTIIGLGGLGGTVIEILARAGIGSMVLVDGDCFEEHNFNRQLLSTQCHLGVSKSQAAAQRVRSINSAVETRHYAMQMNAENAAELIGTSQVVVDCLDNISSRFILEAAARKSRIPLVSAAVAGVCGHVSTIFPQDPGLALIYGPPHELQHDKGVEIELGCLPQAVVTIAALECAEVFKILLEQNDHLLRNRMLMIDLSSNLFEILQLA